MRIKLTVAGLEWDTQMRWNARDTADPFIEFHAGSTHRALCAKMLYSRIMDGDPAYLSRTFEAQAAEIPEKIVEHQAQLDQALAEVAELKQLSSASWPKADELSEKQSRRTNLIAELEAEASPAQSAQPAHIAVPALHTTGQARCDRL